MCQCAFWISKTKCNAEIWCAADLKVSWKPVFVQQTADALFVWETLGSSRHSGGGKAWQKEAAASFSTEWYNYNHMIGPHPVYSCIYNRTSLTGCIKADADVDGVLWVHWFFFQWGHRWWSIFVLRPPLKALLYNLQWASAQLPFGTLVYFAGNFLFHSTIDPNETCLKPIQKPERRLLKSEGVRKIHGTQTCCSSNVTKRAGKEEGKIGRRAKWIVGPMNNTLNSLLATAAILLV